MLISSKIMCYLQRIDFKQKNLKIYFTNYKIQTTCWNVCITHVTEMSLMYLWVYTLYNAMYCIKHITNQFCPKTFIHTCALLLVYNKWVFPRQSFRFMYVWPDQLLVTTNVSYWIKKLSTLFVYHLQIGRILWTIGKTCQTWCTMFCINENFLFW